MATTSPLAAALKPSFAVDDESEAKYQSALKQLSDALEKRRNLPGDAVNAGYLAGLNDPNVRGMGFFAEFASGLKGAREAQQQEAKDEADVAALRLQIAQAEREMARRQKGFQFLTGQEPSLPVRGAEPARAAATGAAAATPAAGATAAAEATPVVTAGNKSGRGVMIGGREVTPALIAQLSYVDPELSKALEQQYKLTMESIAVQPGGYVVKTTGEYVPFGGKAPVTRFVPGNPAAGQKAMTLELSEEDAIAFDKARRDGDAATYYRIIDMYTKPLTRPGAATSAAPSAGQGELAVGTAVPGTVTAKPPSGSFAQTPSEAKAASEVNQKVQETLAVGEATQALKATGEVKTAGKAALALLPVYDRMEQILKTPGIDKVMGVLERGDVQSALGSLVEEAVRVGNFSVGIPAVRKILAQSGAPQEVIDQAATLGQLLALTQFEQRKGLGSGTSVSNFEQQMVNAMGPNMTDTLRSFRQKLTFMREKAKFEAELSKAMRAKKMQYEDFEDTPEFERMFGDYRNRIINIVYPGGPPAKPATPAAPAAAASGAETPESLKARLRAKGQ